MEVTVIFMGPLAEYTGAKAVRMTLSGKGTYGELLDEIDRQFGAFFPEAMWDRERKLFKKGILVVGVGRDLDDPETKLTDGEEIKLVPVFGGG
ncbi:MAG: MoaD/ThiS family protein [Deltaproteobacteria bacterium]|nr:MoaD/ThiS family protein [Deltaproteobacteria bacterium]